MPTTTKTYKAGDLVQIGPAVQRAMQPGRVDSTEQCPEGPARVLAVDPQGLARVQPVSIEAGSGSLLRSPRTTDRGDEFWVEPERMGAIDWSEHKAPPAPPRELRVPCTDELLALARNFPNELESKLARGGFLPAQARQLRERLQRMLELLADEHAR
jgi:hypothetical protein